MRLLHRAKSNRRKHLLVPIGIVLLIVSMVFGVMKFIDVFSQSDDTQVLMESTDETESKDQSESNHTDLAPTQTTQDSNPGPTDGVGALSWVVNKRRPLNPKTYTPPDLIFPNVRLRVPGNQSMQIRADVGTAIEQLFTGAQAAGHDPMFSSGYRSYSYQVSLYNGYVNSQGQSEADKQSARPGYSEHQTGLAFDICNAGNCKLEESFGTTPLGQWIAAHAHEYGFIIRYPESKQAVTGYIYEPWHLRYVGTDTAAQVYTSGKTLEEFYGLPAAPDYN